MSVIARSTYMASKVALVQQKIQPVVDVYQDVCEMGVQAITYVNDKIAEAFQAKAELESQIGDYITKQQQRAMEVINKLITKLQARLTKLITRVTASKDSAISTVEGMASSATSGISGITVELDITPPDPITGTGGSLTPTITPALFDESTLLVKNTLTDPTTTVNSTVTGSSASGGPVVGVGLAQGITVL